ncbi:hypothetical protein [Streptomyces sp. NPDC059649]|uniref:hypothetical protein n=1 Tax=Streptomyces sp. NPDC059649 TaxID=3346895 RepID=UPI003698A6C4
MVRSFVDAGCAPVTDHRASAIDQAAVDCRSHVTGHRSHWPFAARLHRGAGMQRQRDGTVPGRGIDRWPIDDWPIDV